MRRSSRADITGRAFGPALFVWWGQRQPSHDSARRRCHHVV